MTVPVHPIQHITSRHTTHRRASWVHDELYDIPEHRAVFYIAEAINALNVIHKVQ